MIKTENIVLEAIDFGYKSIPGGDYEQMYKSVCNISDYIEIQKLLELKNMTSMLIEMSAELKEIRKTLNNNIELN